MKTLSSLAIALLMPMIALGAPATDDTSQYRYERLSASEWSPEESFYLRAYDRTAEWGDYTSFRISWVSYENGTTLLYCYYYGEPIEAIEMEIPFSADSGVVTVDTSMLDNCWGTLAGEVVTADCSANGEWSADGTEVRRYTYDDTTYTSHYQYTDNSADCVVWVVGVDALDANGSLRSARSMDHESRGGHEDGEDECD